MLTLTAVIIFWDIKQTSHESVDRSLTFFLWVSTVRTLEHFHVLLKLKFHVFSGSIFITAGIFELSICDKIPLSDGNQSLEY